MNPVLRAAELLLQRVNAARRALYRRGVFRATRLPRPVISVGNIAMGGAGKTPVTIAVARFLGERGVKVAVLTRGYGRADRSVTGAVDSVDAARWGDEPVLIKKHAPNAVVIVGEKRAENALRFMDSESIDAFLLDDGFQHLQLHRDFDLVVDNPAARFHRESRAALARADRVIERRMRIRDTAGLVGRRLFAFSALADNSQFFESLRRAGLDVVGTHGFPDHHRYTSGDLDSLRTAANRAGADVIVTTEKDGVKIAAPDIVAVAAEAEIDPDVLEEIYETIVRAKTNVARR